MKFVMDIFKNIEKKYLYIGGGFIALMVFAGIFGACNKKTPRQVVSGYEGIKEVMVQAATKYYEDNPIYLPNEGEKIQITAGSLYNNGYMKELNEYAPKGVECEGKVSVTRMDKEYNYIAFLDCGDAFSELALYETIIEDNPIVEQGNGLYQIEDEKIFRGEPKNNYLKFGETLYRILKIDKDNNVTISYHSKINQNVAKALNTNFVWDNRFNSDQMERIGVNNFDLSRIKETLHVLEENEEIIPKELKPILEKRQLCIGKIKEDHTLFDNSVECSTLSEESYYLGLLTASEFIRSSLDPNCNSLENPACSNYNYLAGSAETFWTLTGMEDNSYQVLANSSRGLIKYSTNSNGKVRPLIILSSTTIKTVGDGTKEKPYEIKAK